VLFLKFGAALTIICGYERLFDGGFLVDEWTTLYCNRAVFAEVARVSMG
jgi:hypothetical protein